MTSLVASRVQILRLFRDFNRADKESAPRTPSACQMCYHWGTCFRARPRPQVGPLVPALSLLRFGALTTSRTVGIWPGAAAESLWINLNTATWSRSSGLHQTRSLWTTSGCIRNRTPRTTTHLERLVNYESLLFVDLSSGCHTSTNSLLKCADDTTAVGLMSGEGGSAQGAQIQPVLKHNKTQRTVGGLRWTPAPVHQWKLHGLQIP